MAPHSAPIERFAGMRNFSVVGSVFLSAWLATGLPLAPAQAQPAVMPATPNAIQPCQPRPLGKRDLYLRGSFNGWAAADAYRFVYQCNRFELVTSLQGQQTFKIGDEDWSVDADFGAANPAGKPPWALATKGKEMHYDFRGSHRLVLNMSASAVPASSSSATLAIESCPAAPLGESTLFLRGTMNNWAALDDFAFRYSCDAYYLNVRLQGRQEFKIGDAGWTQPGTLGGAGGQGVALAAGTASLLGRASADGAGNLAFEFAGEHTLRIAFENGKPMLHIGARTFASPDEVAVTDPLALSASFDSRLAAHKSPFGAVPAGTAVDFSLDAAPGLTSATLVIEKRRMEGNQEQLAYSEVARIPLVGRTSPDGERWTGRYPFSDPSVYGYYFEVVANGKTFVVQNNRDSIYWTREKGSNGRGQVDDMPAERKRIRRFRHTVYAADFKVPAWAADVIYYYIFPDRFRNGNTANDPQPGKRRYQDKGIELHRNWMDRPYKPGSGDGSDDTYNNDFFGGDLAGIIEKLDYIAELGANTIYMTPVFAAASNHKYDTADYRNIDPAFGSNEDFERLSKEASRRGIRVIPDTSLNHVGSDSVYFDRFGNYQGKGAFAGGKIHRDSPYASWFRFDQTQTDPDKQYKGWVDVKDLPEIDKSSPAFRQFAYGAPDSVMKLWLERGASGWRMDVAPWVPDDFWREWRRAIKQYRPDALTIAETWFDASKFFLGDTFDSTMNYIFRNTVLDYAKGGNAKQLYQNLELIREVYPPQSFYALMNLLSTHDAARGLHVFGYENDNTDPARIAEAKQRLRLAVFFQMVYPGAPTIYYGDEVGVTGGDDPYNRGPYPWADRGGKPDLALLADFKALIRMRKENAVLRHGSISAPLFADDHVIVLARQLGDTWAITATNNATAPRTVSVTLPDSAQVKNWKNALTGETVQTAGRTVSLTVPALFGVGLISR